jgi:large subunit ribosomal protein L13
MGPGYKVNAMPAPATKTTLPRPGTKSREWLLIDAKDKVLGRLAVRLATLLMGKHKPIYCPHEDVGDFIVLVNARHVRVSGRKMQQKEYDTYTYYPGGRKVQSLEQMMQRHPDRVVRLAVRRMLPKNRLARQQLKKLKIYPDSEHKHQAQNPRPYEVAC